MIRECSTKFSPFPAICLIHCVSSLIVIFFPLCGHSSFQTLSRLEVLVKLSTAKCFHVNTVLPMGIIEFWSASCSLALYSDALCIENLCSTLVCTCTCPLSISTIPFHLALTCPLPRRSPSSFLSLVILFLPLPFPFSSIQIASPLGKVAEKLYGLLEKALQCS